MARPETALSDLPAELVGRVLKYLAPDEQEAVALTSKASRDNDGPSRMFMKPQCIARALPRRRLGESGTPAEAGLGAPDLSALPAVSPSSVMQ